MLELKNNSQLPNIPDKRYFTIGEVADLCAVKPHVLRYWEQEFAELKVVKQRGSRRHYQRDDIILICQLKSLLYEQGYTIDAAKTYLASNKNHQQIVNAKLQIQQLTEELDDILKILA